jgi:large subunit ribosomal protein L22
LEARAYLPHIRISPTKVQIVLDLIRGKSVDEAIAILKYTPKRASAVVTKLVESAAANAVNNQNANRDDLKVSEIFVGAGPTLKRFQPRQRGQGFSILKRTSHVTVVVSDGKED